MRYFEKMNKKVLWLIPLLLLLSACIPEYQDSSCADGFAAQNLTETGVQCINISAYNVAGDNITNNITYNASTTKYVTSQVSTTSNSLYTAVPELTFNLSASGQSIIECTIFQKAAADTTGIRHRITTTGASNVLTVCDVYRSQTSVAVYSGNSAAEYCNPSSSAGTLILPYKVYSTSTRSSTGTFTVELVSEVSGSYVTVEQGSYCTLTNI